jgi:hypothetical protein
MEIAVLLNIDVVKGNAFSYKLYEMVFKGEVKSLFTSDKGLARRKKSYETAYKGA